MIQSIPFLFLTRDLLAFKMMAGYRLQFLAMWASPWFSSQLSGLYYRVSLQDGVIILCNVIMEVTSYYLYHTLLAKIKPQIPSTLKGRRLYKDMNIRR